MSIGKKKPSPRAARIERMRLAFNRASFVQDPDEFAIDLLADLRHYCHAKGLTFGNLDKIAHRHYVAEKVQSWL